MLKRTICNYININDPSSDAFSRNINTVTVIVCIVRASGERCRQSGRERGPGPPRVRVAAGGETLPAASRHRPSSASRDADAAKTDGFVENYCY